MVRYEKFIKVHEKPRVHAFELCLQHFSTLNPLSAGIFTVFGQFIRGQSVTQRSMGREAPRYPPQYPGP